MAKTAPALSHYARDALRLLGLLIRQRRLEQRITVEELAQRGGVSRGLVQRVERGHPAVAVGSVLELAAIVGVPLFDPDKSRLASAVASTEKTLSLLPAAARTTQPKLDDDF